MEISEKLLHIPGLYCIKNKINGKAYYGSSVSIARRYLTHITYLRKGCGQNQHLQRAFQKYCEENFIFIIIEYFKEITKKELLEKEQLLLDTYKPYIYGYNMAHCATSNKGYKKTDEQRQRSSIAIKKYYDEHPEVKKILSANKMGEKNHRFGKNISDTHRQILIEANKKPCKEETKEKIREKRKNQHFSEEDKKKMSKPRSDAGRNNIANAMKMLKKTIIQFDEYMNVIDTWDSSKEIAEILKYSRGTIAFACKMHCKRYGFYWKYKEEHNE